MTRRPRWFLAGGLLVAVLLAGVVSNFASASPDGLDATARKGCTVNADGQITGGSCMLQQERSHQLADSPLAGYGIRGIDNPYVSTGLAGVAGVLITFTIGAGAFRLVRRRDHATTPGFSAPPEGPDTGSSTAPPTEAGPSDDTTPPAGSGLGNTTAPPTGPKASSTTTPPTGPRPGNSTTPRSGPGAGSTTGPSAESGAGSSTAPSAGSGAGSSTAERVV